MSESGITFRLRRVEGQIRGLQRMIDAGSDCEEIMTQLLAARSALDQVGLLIIGDYVERCLLSGNEIEIRDKFRKIFGLVLGRYSLTSSPPG